MSLNTSMEPRGEYLPLNTLPVSRHAERRLQQRAIPVLMIHWLLAFGSRVHGRDGCEILVLDRQARKQLRNYAGRLAMRRLRDFLDIYLVLDDGIIVTAGHHYQRLGADRKS